MEIVSRATGADRQLFGSVDNGSPVSASRAVNFSGFGCMELLHPPVTAASDEIQGWESTRDNLSKTKQSMLAVLYREAVQ